ncbi:MAG TPA: hypothetical protein VJQ09_09150, partial [Candidatus Limnocylindria bacterium]|nr:hypothetical protein [Candidatus Limnocylindria bacterium]
VRGQRADPYRWSEVRSVSVRRGAILIKTEAPREKVVKKKGIAETQQYVEKRTTGLRIVVEGVDEPTLAPLFASVLEDMRGGKFSYRGTSWLEYQNGIDHLKGEFHYQDDEVMPLAAAGLWVAIGLMSIFLVPIAVNAATVRTVPAGAFAIWDPLGPFDPRSIIAGFALAAMAAVLVLRLALGKSSMVWARGAARGWARPDSRPLARLVARVMGRLTVETPTAAIVVLLSLLAFWPNTAATVIVDPTGVRNEVLLPIVSLEEKWRSTTSITKEGQGVTIRFIDGRIVGTQGHELGGGTQNQFFDLTNQWWKAALGTTPR